MNEKAKHTPGPWVVLGKYNATDLAFGRDDESLAPVGAVLLQPRSDVQQANARLIAAAPELADALELARNLLIQADLSPLTAGSHPEERPGHEDGVHASLETIEAALRKAGRL